MGRPKKEIIPVKKCLHCGKELGDKNFYKSNGSIYTGNNNFLPVCKECMKILCEQYRIKYTNQFSVLGTEPKEHEMEKLAVKRVCMAFDIYYSDSLFEAALKQIEKFPNLDFLSAYMRIVNLKQNRKKSYDNTVLEEDLSQELIKSAVVSKVKEKFDDGGLYQDIYDLCLQLMQALRKNCNFDIKKNDYGTND
ncbi:MAG: hypothetical protein K2I10_11690 [Lachnospiraceae bacterium]|nr:hypothetical protein [Lachnospiraceae bacterium]